MIHISSGIGQAALAQSPITARVERTSLAIDEQLVLNVTVTGDFLKIPRPDLSQLEDFVVVSSSTSTQVSIVNGQMTSQGVFIYRLQPLKEGNLIIPPVSVNIDGQLYQTDPIEIEVLAAGTAQSGQSGSESGAPNTLHGQDFFVEAEVSDATPYLGEQVIYIFRIYQAISFPPGQPDYTPPSFTDFWSSEILAQPHYDIRANGREYQVTEILTALFAANLGTITIEPASLIVPGSLLSPDIRLETNPVTLDVQPLPEGAPDDFTGAVGVFNVHATLSATESKVNEPLTLVIEIEGEGNIQTLREPELPELVNWRFFESQATTKTETSEGVLRGSRIFERLVVPGQPGQQSIPAISFGYYDPTEEAYKTVSTTPIEVNILPDATTPAVGGAGLGLDKQPVELIAADIRHIKPVPSSLNMAGRSSILRGAFFWSCWLAPFLFIGAAWVWQNRRQRLRQDTAFARNLRARRAAFKILNEAGQSHADNYASVAGRALLGYLSDKLNKPTAGLTTDNLLKLLQESRLEQEHLERIADLLHQIDVGRFAPVSTVDGQTMIMETKELIDDIERAFNNRRR